MNDETYTIHDVIDAENDVCVCDEIFLVADDRVSNDEFPRAAPYKCDDDNHATLKINGRTFTVTRMYLVDDDIHFVTHKPPLDFVDFARVRRANDDTNTQRDARENNMYHSLCEIVEAVEICRSHTKRIYDSLCKINDTRAIESAHDLISLNEQCVLVDNAAIVNARLIRALHDYLNDVCERRANDVMICIETINPECMS